MTEVNLIVEDLSNKDFYERLLHNNGIKIVKSTLLSDNLNYLKSKKLLIIDIKSLRMFSLLEKLEFSKNQYVIFISPFSNNFTLTFEAKTYFLNKPLNINKFLKLIQTIEETIKKEQYLENKQEILFDIINQSPIRMATFDLDGKIIYANEAYLYANNIINIVDNTYFDDFIKCRTNFADLVNSLKTKRLITKEQKEEDKWYKSFFYTCFNGNTIFHLCFDNTEEKTQLELLKKSALLFEQSNEGVLISDSSGFITEVNGAFCKITGFTKDEAIGKKTNILKSGIHDKEFYKNLWDSLKIAGFWQGEVWNKRKNGEIYPEWLSISKCVDPNNNEVSYMAIFNDITSIKNADKKLKYYARHDHLTGLLNKSQFEYMLNQTIRSAIRHQRKFALFFIDLDYFKEINDTCGHNIGDLVLKEISRRLQKVLRKEDIIARIGGDEFTIITDNLHDESAPITLAEKLSEIIKKPLRVENHTFYPTISVGISIFPLHGLNVNELSKNADSAMYEVKKNGRDGYKIYHSDFSKTLEKKVSLHNELKKALEDDELEVYFQIVLDMKTNLPIGAEALIRWNNHTRGFVSPEEFIPIAEHHGMIEKIGSFVFQKCCENMQLFLKKFGKDFTIAINVSSKEFSQENFVKHISEMVNDFQVSTKNLEIEITETYLMQNQDIAIQKMYELKELGLSLALDDFGTGFSSLSYLKKFPLNKVKIDKSFILDILTDEGDKDMVIAIINIARIFNLQVQAEGVETKEHYEILKKLNCDIAQGYCYSKPMSIEDIMSKDWPSYE